MAKNDNKNASTRWKMCIIVFQTCQLLFVVVLDFHLPEKNSNIYEFGMSYVRVCVHLYFACVHQFDSMLYLVIDKQDEILLLPISMFCCCRCCFCYCSHDKNPFQCFEDMFIWLSFTFFRWMSFSIRIQFSTNNNFQVYLLVVNAHSLRFSAFCRLYLLFISIEVDDFGQRACCKLPNNNDYNEHKKKCIIVKPNADG